MRTFCVSRYFRLIGSLRKGLFFSYSASFFSFLCTKDWLETNFPRTWREWINWLLQQPSVLYIFSCFNCTFFKSNKISEGIFNLVPSSSKCTKSLSVNLSHSGLVFAVGAFGKVRTFWEASKNLRNLPHALDIYLVQSMWKIFSNFVRFSESPNFTWQPQNSRTSCLVSAIILKS